MSDPFDVLHRPIVPARPRPQFVIALRRRLQEELSLSLTDDLSTDDAFRVEHGALGLVHLRVADADRAIVFFGAAFGWRSERFDGDGHVSHYVNNTEVTVRLMDDPGAADVRPNYRVRDVAAAVAAIEVAGGRVTSADVRPDGSGWAFADDAAGLPLLVYRPTDAYHDTADVPVRADVGLVFLVESEQSASPFYRSVLGWELRPDHDGSTYYDAAPRVGVWDEAAATGASVAPSITLYLEVPALAPAVADIRRLGGTADDVPADPDMGPLYTVRCTDDQGTRFGLLSPRRA